MKTFAQEGEISDSTADSRSIGLPPKSRIYSKWIRWLRSPSTSGAGSKPAPRHIPPTFGQFPSSQPDVEFVQRCLMGSAALTWTRRGEIEQWAEWRRGEGGSVLLVFSCAEGDGGRRPLSLSPSPRCCAHLVGCQAPLEGDKQTATRLGAVRLR